MIQESTSDLSLILPLLCSLRVINLESMAGTYEVDNESINSSPLIALYFEDREPFHLMIQPVFGAKCPDANSSSQARQTDLRFLATALPVSRAISILPTRFTPSLWRTHFAAEN